MQDLIIYLLKSGGLLSLFYIAFVLLLKKETSFTKNRFFLIAGILTSLFLPFLEITRTAMVKANPASIALENLSPAPVTQSEMGATPQFDWWHITGMIYLIGLGFLLLKFLFELCSLLWLIYSHDSGKERGHYLIRKAGNSQPFSFFKFIVFDPTQYGLNEQDLILRHEHSHARQWHSIDQILSSLCTYCLWFNPLAWSYRENVVQNLEYLADHEVIASQVSTTEYQRTLLKVSFGDIGLSLTNQFNQSLVKNRILMLNKTKSQEPTFWRTAVLLPFLAIFIFLFNIKTEARPYQEQEKPVISKTEISAYITKNSDKKSLHSYERIFQKHGVKLNFTKVRYSEGLLTGLSVSYKDLMGEKGEMSLNDPQGIMPLLIFTDGEKIVMTQDATIPEKSKDPLADLGNSPLYIIAGKKYSTAQLSGKYVQVQEGWSVVNPQEAVTQYGKNAKDGAIVIVKENIAEDFKEALKNMDFAQMPIKQTFIHVKKDGTPMLVGVDSKIQMSKSPKKSKFEEQEIKLKSKSEDIFATQQEDAKAQKINFQGPTPLLVVDGKIQDKNFSIEEIEPSTIKKMNVLKGPEAVEKYGEQEKNGVVEITLKSREERESEATEKKTPVFLSSWKFEDEEKGNSTFTILSGNKTPSTHMPSESLVVLDGEIMKKGFDPDSVEQENIEKITILKGPQALEKYGTKAAKGVIEIITKN